MWAEVAQIAGSVAIVLGIFALAASSRQIERAQKTTRLQLALAIDEAFFRFRRLRARILAGDYKGASRTASTRSAACAAAFSMLACTLGALAQPGGRARDPGWRGPTARRPARRRLLLGVPRRAHSAEPRPRGAALMPAPVPDAVKAARKVTP